MIIRHALCCPDRTLAGVVACNMEHPCLFLWSQSKQQYVLFVSTGTLNKSSYDDNEDTVMVGSYCSTCRTTPEMQLLLSACTSVFSSNNNEPCRSQSALHRLRLLKHHHRSSPQRRSLYEKMWCTKAWELERANNNRRDCC